MTDKKEIPIEIHDAFVKVFNTLDARLLSLEKNNKKPEEKPVLPAEEKTIKTCGADCLWCRSMGYK